MAANVFATPGVPYLAPTSVTGTTGTAILGILERDIGFLPQVRTRTFNNGVGVNSGPRILHMRRPKGRLFIPLRQQDANGLKLLLSHLTTDGLAFRPSGGTATAEFAFLPTFALIVRPTKTDEKYIYSPNWQLTQESVQLIMHSPLSAQLEGATLEMVASKPTNASGPPFEWASSAAIAAAYGLSENPA